GRLALGSFAADMACNHRTLIARFRTCVGFPPKTIARLLRFNRVLRAIDRLSVARAHQPVGMPYLAAGRPEDLLTDSIGWADLAPDGGYVDQPHLIKDFREFAGTTPAAFVRAVSFRT